MKRIMVFCIFIVTFINMFGWLDVNLLSDNLFNEQSISSGNYTINGNRIGFIYFNNGQMIGTKQLVLKYS